MKRKSGVIEHLRELNPCVDIKMLTSAVYLCVSPTHARSMYDVAWHRGVNCVRSKDAQKQLARTSLNILYTLFRTWIRRNGVGKANSGPCIYLVYADSNEPPKIGLWYLVPRGNINTVGALCTILPSNSHQPISVTWTREFYASLHCWLRDTLLATTVLGLVKGCMLIFPVWSPVIFLEHFLKVFLLYSPRQ